MVLSKLNILMVESGWSSRAGILNAGLHLVLSPPLQTFRKQGSGSDGFLWCYGQNLVQTTCMILTPGVMALVFGAAACLTAAAAVLHFLHFLLFSFYIFTFTIFIL